MTIEQSRNLKLGDFDADGCACCQGDEGLYWKDEANNAYVDSKGDMLVTVNGKEMQFRIKYCPNCGKVFE